VNSVEDIYVLIPTQFNRSS